MLKNSFKVIKYITINYMVSLDLKFDNSDDVINISLENYSYQGLSLEFRYFYDVTAPEDQRNILRILYQVDGEPIIGDIIIPDFADNISVKLNDPNFEIFFMYISSPNVNQPIRLDLDVCTFETDMAVIYIPNVVLTCTLESGQIVTSYIVKQNTLYTNIIT